MDHLDIAEDIASETFVQALETWPYKGVPENPVAWLYAVAKNKAKNVVHRRKIYAGKVVGSIIPATVTHEDAEIDLTEKNISDSQLQMIFALCHPSISAKAQIGLALRILCGFGIEEIANAFLTNKESINKLLFRAKEKLRQEKVKIEFPDEAGISLRLDNVLLTLYLLFNEGYYSESHPSVLRKNLCLEAMRLTTFLVEYEPTNLPKVNALLSLMCFHASRFPAREDAKGEIVLYQDQDESLWNHDLIARGVYFLHQASQGTTLSKYHLEAGIAYHHTMKSDTNEKWETILQLYNQLLRLEYSPVAALNRTFALSKARGKRIAIPEAEKLQLTDNQYYFALLGELYTGIDNDRAIANFKTALSLAKTVADQNVLAKKIHQISGYREE